MSVLDDDPRDSKSWRLCLRRWRELAGAATRARRTATTPEAFAAWLHIVGERPVLVTQRFLDWDRASRPGRSLLGPPVRPPVQPPVAPPVRPPLGWWPPLLPPQPPAA